MAVPRRYSQDEVDALLANAQSATKAELSNLRDDVTKVAKGLGDLTIALVGLPGVSQGAIPEIREQIAALTTEWATYQAALPAAINAGVEAQRGKDTVQRAHVFTRWWQLVTANAVSGALGGLFIFLITHHW